MKERDIEVFTGYAYRLEEELRRIAMHEVEYEKDFKYREADIYEIKDKERRAIELDTLYKNIQEKRSQILREKIDVVHTITLECIRDPDIDNNLCELLPRIAFQL